MLRIKHWVEWCAASGSQAAALSRVDVRTHDICVQFVRHNHDPTFSLACLDAATAYPGPPCPLRACCRLPLTTARHRDGTRFALCPRSFPLGGGIVIHEIVTERCVVRRGSRRPGTYILADIEGVSLLHFLEPYRASTARVVPASHYDLAHHGA